jgi:hypothetical protein
MSIIHKDKPYCVVVLTHRATGLFHLVLTTLTPSAYDVSSMIAYMNDFAKRTHRINNYALREFLNAYAPVSAGDFDQRFLCHDVTHEVAKAIAITTAHAMGAGKLLTAHTVKPAAWELNLMAKMRMQDDQPSPYGKAITASVPIDQEYGSKPLTKAQFDAMCQHVCHGKSAQALNVELDMHENTVVTCHSTLPAWAWSKQRAAEIKEYLDVFSIYTTHGKYLY